MHMLWLQAGTCGSICGHHGREAVSRATGEEEEGYHLAHVYLKSCMQSCLGCQYDVKHAAIPRANHSKARPCVIACRLELKSWPVRVALYDATFMHRSMQGFTLPVHPSMRWSVDQ